MKPTLTLIETHRPVILDYDRSPEPDTPVVFTGAEVIFGFFLGGVIGSLVTCGAAWIIAEFAL